MASGRRAAALFAISLAIGSTIAAPARAGVFADCARDAAGRELAAKTGFQRGLRDLIVRQRAAFKPLADVNMALQIAYAEARRAKFDYLLKHDAGRVDTTAGLSRFTNFAWSDADTEKLRAESRLYQALEKRLATLKEQNNAHPDWPQMRQYIRGTLAQSPDFKILMARFQARQKEVAAMISKCRQR